jgi:hypothetical protein
VNRAGADVENYVVAAKLILVYHNLSPLIKNLKKIIKKAACAAAFL